MIEERTFMDPWGRPVTGVFVRNSPWRGLLMAQRHEHAAHSRFRRWRFELNDATRRRSGMAEIYAHMVAHECAVDAAPKRPFEYRVIEGGKQDDQRSLDLPVGAQRIWDNTWAEQARARWRETDGFARIDP